MDFDESNLQDDEIREHDVSQERDISVDLPRWEFKHVDEYADVLRIDEVEELESGEEQDVCLSLGVANEARLSLDQDAVAEEEKGFCIEEEHFEFQKCPSPIKLSPAGKNPAVF